MLADFYALELPLIARLRDTVPAAQAVYRLSDPALLAQRQAAVTPAILVTFGGAVTGERSGGSSRVTQRWLVAPAGRTLAGTRDASAGRDEIGEIVSGAIRAAHRWDHGIVGLTELQFAGMQPPQYVDSYLVHPIIFEAHLIVA